MKLSQFILLPAQQKQSVVLHNGVLIGKRKENNIFIFLFQMDFFYVEMYCAIANKQVTEYRVFNQPALLNPYIDLVEIDGLL